MQGAAAVAPVAEADGPGVQHSGVDNKTLGNAERFGLFMVGWRQAQLRLLSLRESPMRDFR